MAILGLFFYFFVIIIVTSKFVYYNMLPMTRFNSCRLVLEAIAVPAEPLPQI